MRFTARGIEMDGARLRRATLTALLGGVSQYGAVRLGRCVAVLPHLSELLWDECPPVRLWLESLEVGSRKGGREEGGRRGAPKS